MGVCKWRHKKSILLFCDTFQLVQLDIRLVLLDSVA